MEVTSEILPYFQRDTNSKPLINVKNVISKFTFSSPSSKTDNYDTIHEHLEKDSDGDYIVKRKNEERSEEITISLEHGTSTELKLVGLQIWRGALLLADFLIFIREELLGKTVLEVGTGVGLTSVVAGMYAKQIICTDVDRGDILKLLQHNMNRNKQLIKSQVFVCHLDFFNQEWSIDLKDKMREVSIVLAADVIYDNDVTEAFIQTITKIMNIPPKKTLYLAMEKRYVFTLADLDSVAPCYEHFMSFLGEQMRKKPCCDWTLEEISLDFPQYFNYERVKELIMFKISS